MNPFRFEGLSTLTKYVEKADSQRTRISTTSILFTVHPFLFVPQIPFVIVLRDVRFSA